MLSFSNQEVINDGIHFIFDCQNNKKIREEHIEKLGIESNTYQSVRTSEKTKILKDLLSIFDEGETVLIPAKSIYLSKSNRRMSCQKATSVKKDVLIKLYQFYLGYMLYRKQFSCCHNYTYLDINLRKQETNKNNITIVTYSITMLVLLFSSFRRFI